MALKCSVGAKTSASFITAAEADIAAVRLLPASTESDWGTLTTIEKEWRLMLAGQLMGILPWRGRKTFKQQALCFPRDSQDNTKIIPDEIRDAQFLIAHDLVHRGMANLPEVTEELGPRVTSVSLGGVLAVRFGDQPLKGGTTLEQFIRSSSFQIYMLCKRYLTQIRGRTVPNLADIVQLGPTTTTTTVLTTTTSTNSTSSSTTTAP